MVSVFSQVTMQYYYTELGILEDVPWTFAAPRAWGSLVEDTAIPVGHLDPPGSWGRVEKEPSCKTVQPSW